MTKEIKSIVKKAINESEKNGYKWTVTPHGLKWAYCDVEFIFYYDSQLNILKVYDETDQVFIAILIGRQFYADAKDIESAYYKATLDTIYKANYLY